MSLVIVALPEEDELVYKVSSEKVPHLTLLYLGELTVNTPLIQIAQFIEHAAKGLTPFWAEVDYRGILGDDEADVLFFEKRWMKSVVQFREDLLKNDAIRVAYDSAEQYPEWTPHLTLGYPTAPAKPTDRKLFSVSFNRVALWLGDSQGPEFRLESPSYDGEDLAMSDIKTQGEEAVNELLHYGVKGMKWGVRRSSSERAAAKKAATTPVEAKGESFVRARKSAKTKIKTSGGENQPAAEEAIKVAVARQKLKKSGVASLSNKELQDVANRLDLEARVKRLDPGAQAPGKSFVTQLRKANDLANLGVQTVNAQRNAAKTMETLKRKK